MIRWAKIILVLLTLFWAAWVAGYWWFIAQAFKISWADYSFLDLGLNGMIMLGPFGVAIALATIKWSRG
jgi:hypothetical protein